MKRALLARLLCALWLILPVTVFGQAPSLGTAASFALFTANGAFANTGASMITGDVGTNVGLFSGFPPGSVTGQIRLAGSPQANQAATDVTAAYTALNGPACDVLISPTLGNGQVLTPGVYCQNTAAASSLTGTLVLSGAGLYIIRLNSAFTVAAGAVIQLTNGACANNVFFRINGAVDVGAGAVLKGTLVADGAIGFGEGASLEGRGLSVAGAIALSNNAITVPSASCTTATTGTASLSGSTYDDNNKSGSYDGGDTPLGGVTVTLLNASSTAVGSTTTSVGGAYSFTGLTAGTPYLVSFSTPGGYSATAPGGVSGPVTLTAGVNNPAVDQGYTKLSTSLALDLRVDKSQAEPGDVITYTVVLTNSGNGPASNIVVVDSTSAGLTYVAGSATVPAGTTFVPGSPISTLSVAALGAGESLTLTFQVTVGGSGIFYNTVTLANDVVRVCTTVPFRVCANESFEFLLSVPNSYSAYQWSRNGQPIVGATSSTLSATAVGEYTVMGDGIGDCPTGACCPFVILANPAPSLTAVAVSLCVGLPLNLTALLASNGNVLTGLTTTLLGGAALPTNLTVAAGVNLFTVVSTNVNGCSAVTPISVTGVATLAILSSATICAGASATLLATGGTSYTLVNSGAVNATGLFTVSPTTTTIYSVVVANATGCTAAATSTVTVIPAASVTLTASSNAVCVGQSVLLTTQVAPVGSYTYTVSGPVGVSLTGQTTATASNLPTGVNTFTVTVTSPTCTTTAVVSVTVNNTPLLTLTASQSAICVGQSVTLTAGGVGATLVSIGTQGPLGTLLNPTVGAINPTAVFSPTATTTFLAATLPVIGGVLNSCPVTVVVNQPPVLAPLGLSVCAGASLNLASLTGPAGSLSALMGLTNVFRPGSSTTAAALTGPVTINAGVNLFNVVSTNASGCSAVTPISVTGIALPALAGVSASLCVGLPLNLTALLASNGNVLTGLTTTLLGNVALPTNLSVAAGVNLFNVVSTNASGCSAVTPISVTGVATPALAGVSASLCVGLPLNLTALLASNGNVLTGLTTTLLGNVALPTNLSVTAGVNLFTVVSTNASGCSAVTPISITGVATHSLSAVSVSLCVGLPLNLTALLASNGNSLTGLTTTLLGGATLPTNLSVAAGVNLFTVVSTNPSGCSAVTPISITGVATPSLSAVSVSLCVGLPLNLTALLASNGNSLTGLTTTLLGGATLPTNLSVAAGVNLFSVVSTNVSGCSAVTPISVTGIVTPALASVSASLCVGLPLNLTALLASNGNVLTGLTTTLLGGAALPTNLSVAAGVNLFTVVSTNPSGCSAVTPISITGVATPSLNVVSASLCVGLPLNLTALLASNGNILTGLTTTLLGNVALPTNLSVTAGVNLFSVVSTNASGCSAVTPISVTGIAIPALSPISASLCVGVPLNLTALLASNGNVLTGLTTTLLGGAVLPTNLTVAAGVNLFTVVSTNASGCSAVTPISVTGVAIPSLSALAVSVQCVGQTPQADGAITLVGSSTAAVSYNITKGSSFTAAPPLFTTPQALSAVIGGVLLGGQPNPAVAQDYTIRVYSTTGCFADFVVTLQPALCSCPPPICLPIVVKRARIQGKL